MLQRLTGALLLFAFALMACDDSPTENGAPSRLEFDFTADTQGWVAGFADYPAGEEEEHALASGHEPLPEPLDASRGGVLLSGRNHSDDLFMFLKRRVEGFEPGAAYRLRFRVEFATNAPRECSGVGGAPGESVTVKAGASAVEPLAVADGTGTLRMNIDKGEQSAGGEAAIVLGHIANSSTDCFDPPYELKVLESGAEGLDVTADAQGRFWLIVGTDSGYESTTSLYYTSVRVDIEVL